MKFEKITDNKIKIIITIKDIESLDISSQNILTNSYSSQKLLETMLNKAKNEIGFEVGDSELLVETLYSSHQEYIITITKLVSNININENTHDSFIFKFENFDNFIELCKFLNNLSDLNLNGFSKDFSLILYNNSYYLYNNHQEKYSILFDYMKHIFSEFGTRVSDLTYIDGVLNEYGKLIFDTNAIVNCIYNFI